LDASVALRWFLAKPVPAYAHRVKRLMLAGARAVVPALWHLEMANGLGVAERRRILSAADVDRCVAHIESLLSDAITTDAALVPVRQALTTARAFGLSAYDAAYLEVARRERLELATLDEALRAAAAKSEVAILR
jgi:predicted nucleic acid-binding protein